MSYQAKNDKLVPEWDVEANEQIVIIGALTFMLLSLAIAIGLWRSSGDDDQLALNPSAVLVQAESTGGQNSDLAVSVSSPATSSTIEIESATPTSVVVVTSPSTTESTTTTAQEMPPSTGAIDLEPNVLASLMASGVTESAVTMDGNVATVRGIVPSEEGRIAALAAAADVVGITSVTDELTVVVPVTDRLNELFELAPIQFAISSPQILEASFPTLDAAAEILASAPADTKLEVQGYTDLTGSESANLTLSQQRSDAVVAYLAAKGVDADLLEPKGYGETDQFAQGELAEDYEANRRVRFELLAG